VDGNLGPSVWGAQRTGGPEQCGARRPHQHELGLHELRRLDMVYGGGLADRAGGGRAAGGLRGRALARPAAAVSETVRSDSAGDLDARPGPQGQDEVADIAATVERMADSLGRGCAPSGGSPADVAP